MVDNNEEIPIEVCPYCGENLIKMLPQDEQKKYNGLRYLKLKIGISNWDSVFAWQCPYCSKTWKREI